MGTGQLMLTLGGMILLSLVIFRVNQNFLYTGDIMLSTKLHVLAISVGTSTLEESSAKAFDENTIGDATDNKALLTGAGSLGPESGETFDSFDDFDDYNNLSRIDSSMPAAPFKIEATVSYVDEDDPNNILGTQSWHKRIDIHVTSEFMEDTVSLSKVFSYWYFR